MDHRNIRQSALALLGVAAFLSTVVSTDAAAAGCNGVVDQFKWGCAAWDNNNGPQFPHYKPPKKAQAPARVQAPARPSAPVAGHAVAPNQGNRLIGNDGASLVGNDGASLRR